MKTEIYVVIAYRWGDKEMHSYTLGAFNKKAQAIKCADSHTQYRGGKYSCVVETCVLNEFNNNSNDYITEVYRTKHVGINS